MDLVNEQHPELSGDPVARKEVSSRIAELKTLLETETNKSFDNALWYGNELKAQQMRQSELNNFASILADIRFNQSPKLYNELLNRHKPSASAIAAQNILLRRMVFHEGEPRLGINKFPAEAGLFVSILEKSGLYREVDGEWKLTSPNSDLDPCNLVPLWKVAKRKVQKSTIDVSDLYVLWRSAPFGVKDGLLPVLSVAFILTQKANLAVYREGVFKAHFDDVDIDYLTKDASTIQLRWMNLSDISRKLLSEMATIVRDLDNNNQLNHLKPIDVARGLVAIYDKLPQWTKRTMLLSANAVRIRDLFKRARDPNKFLFDDIPETIGVDTSAIGRKRLE